MKECYVKVSKWMGVALIGALALGLAGCGTKSADTATNDGTAELTGSVNVEGSDTMVNLSGAWAEAFQTAEPGVMVSVKGGGSGVGIASLINGTVDFANASREMKDEEKTQVSEGGREAVEHEVARDGIAVIINPGNGVEGLTSEQVGQIYRGEVTNWKEVGGVDKKIVVLSRDSSSGTYEFFKEEMVGKDKEMAKSAQLLASNQAIVDEVSKNDAAIGYCGVGYVTKSVKVAQLDGVLASVDTVLDGTYPLSRGLYMYSADELSAPMKAYLDFILSPAGQKIVEDEGFVPLAK